MTRGDDKKPRGLFPGLHEHLATLDVAHLSVHREARDLRRRQHRKRLVDTRGQRQRDWGNGIRHGVSPMCSEPLQRGGIAEDVHHPTHRGQVSD